MTEEKNYELSINRLIKVPRSTIWKAWSLPEYLEKWWCPKPWTTEIREFDFRTGGVFDTFMRGPNGEENPHMGIFLEVAPEERIIFTNTLSEGWNPVEPWLAMTAIITMAEKGKETEYAVRVLHKDSDDCRRHADMGFEEGWGTCLDQLEVLGREID